MKCNHSSTRYCRVQSKRHLFFAVQCSECKELIKSPKHGNKLFLKISDIPIKETIHAFEKPAGGDHE